MKKPPLLAESNNGSAPPPFPVPWKVSRVDSGCFVVVRRKTAFEAYQEACPKLATERDGAPPFSGVHCVIISEDQAGAIEACNCLLSKRREIGKSHDATASTKKQKTNARSASRKRSAPRKD